MSYTDYLENISSRIIVHDGKETTLRILANTFNIPLTVLVDRKKRGVELITIGDRVGGRNIDHTIYYNDVYMTAESIGKIFEMDPEVILLRHFKGLKDKGLITDKIINHDVKIDKQKGLNTSLDYITFDKVEEWCEYAEYIKEDVVEYTEETIEKSTETPVVVECTEETIEKSTETPVVVECTEETIEKSTETPVVEELVGVIGNEKLKRKVIALLSQIGLIYPRKKKDSESGEEYIRHICFTYNRPLITTTRRYDAGMRGVLLTYGGSVKLENIVKEEGISFPCMMTYYDYCTLNGMVMSMNRFVRRYNMDMRGKLLKTSSTVKYRGKYRDGDKEFTHVKAYYEHMLKKHDGNIVCLDVFRKRIRLGYTGDMLITNGVRAKRKPNTKN